MFGIFVVWTVDMFCSDEIAEWSCSVAPVVMVMSGLVQRSVRRFMSNGPGCKCGASSWMAEAAVSISGVREAGLGGGRDWAVTQSQQRLSRAHNELWGWDGPLQSCPCPRKELSPRMPSQQCAAVEGRPPWAEVRPQGRQLICGWSYPREQPASARHSLSLSRAHVSWEKAGPWSSPSVPDLTLGKWRNPHGAFPLSPITPTIWNRRMGQNRERLEKEEDEWQFCPGPEVGGRIKTTKTSTRYQSLPPQPPAQPCLPHPSWEQNNVKYPSKSLICTTKRKLGWGDSGYRERFKLKTLRGPH